MLYLALQNTYEIFELGLYKKNNCLDTRTGNKKTISKDLIPLLQDLLTTNNVNLKEITFIAVNQGPGPFTTLRSIIASVNGLNFGSSIPLVGIDGLQALLQEYKNDTYPLTVALLNAFSKEVYFGIQQNNKISTGYTKISDFLQDLQKTHNNKTIQFIGNGIELYRNEVLNTFGEKSFIPEPLPQTCSLQQVAQMGLQRWQNQKNISQELYPLYLKTNTIAPIIKK